MAHPVSRSDIGNGTNLEKSVKSQSKEKHKSTPVDKLRSGWWDYDKSVFCDKQCALYQGFSVGLLQTLCFTKDAFPLVVFIVMCGIMSFIRFISGIYMLGKVIDGCDRLASLCVAKGAFGLVSWGIILVCVACACKDDRGYDVITRNILSRVIFSVFALASFVTYILEIALVSHDSCSSVDFSRLMLAYLSIDTVILAAAVAPCIVLRCKQNKHLMEH